jgi:hypothetical protein
VLPPAGGDQRRRRDIVLLLDRSGSMEGWKMVAARRAAARIVDTLTDADRFAVLAFDHTVETPVGLPDGLVAATDRHRYRAVEHLARMDARGGTELLEPLRRALALLDPGRAGAGRDLVLVLVTDGQVGNEDQILRGSADGLSRVRVHTVGIDQAVNAGFLGRLAGLGGGRCELVESEDRLDDAMERIHRRISSPLVTRVRLTATGGSLVEGTRTPARLPELFDGVPYVVRGRYAGTRPESITLHGTTPSGEAWSVTAPATAADAPALPAIWARGALRDLEDAYAAHAGWSRTGAREELEHRIVGTSLRFGVLCRFTAYVAVDERVVTDGGQPRTIVQPVEAAAGWDLPAGSSGAMPPPMLMAMPATPAGLARSAPARSAGPLGAARSMLRSFGGVTAGGNRGADAGHQDADGVAVPRSAPPPGRSPAARPAGRGGPGGAAGAGGAGGRAAAGRGDGAVVPQARPARRPRYPADGAARRRHRRGRRAGRGAGAGRGPAHRAAGGDPGRSGGRRGTLAADPADPLGPRRAGRAGRAGRGGRRCSAGRAGRPGHAARIDQLLEAVSRCRGHAGECRRGRCPGAAHPVVVANLNLASGADEILLRLA